MLSPHGGFAGGGVVLGSRMARRNGFEQRPFPQSAVVGLIVGASTLVSDLVDLSGHVDVERLALPQDSSLPLWLCLRRVL